MRYKLKLAVLGAISLCASQAADSVFEGFLKREFYQDVLRADAEADPTAGVTSTSFVSAFEVPTNIGANFTHRLSGWYTPATTGDYVFFIAADDDSDLFLSTDDTPANKKLIAQESGWSAARNYTVIGGGSLLEDKRSDTFAASEWTPTANKITLTAGTKYWVEAYAHEGGGGDNLAVTIIKAGDPTPANGTIDAAGGTFSTTGLPLAVVTQPANVSAVENTSASFTVESSATPGVTYQWQVGGVDIAGATNATYTFNPPVADNGKKYKVVLKAGTETATSNEATLTVTSDTTPPTMVAGAFLARDGVAIYFNEPMLVSTLGAPANYALNSGATITSVEVVGDRTVFLKTSALTAGASYTVTVTGVKDQSTGGGNAVTPNTATFKAPAVIPAAQAELKLAHYERWGADEGVTSLDTLEEAIVAGTPAAVNAFFPLFEGPVGAADGYSARIQGYFTPPVSGSYVFFGATDDNGRFYLSTDSDPANKKLIATENLWSNSRQWVNGSTPANKRSDQFVDTEWVQGNTMALVGGQKYYAELRFNEGGGGDNGAMTYKLVSEPDPVDGDAPRISGDASNLVWYADVSTSSPIFSKTPASKVFKKGDTVTLEADAFGAAPITYQWFKNKKPITGATSKTLTLTGADYDDIGDYQIEATNAQGAVRAGNGPSDDNSRLYMDGIDLLIEAEDYNYDGNQHKVEADSPSYRGDAYKGLKGKLDVDFFHDGDNSAGAAFAYTRATATDEGVIEDKGGTDAVNNALGRLRGSFSVDANYALGWTAATEWQNYTRTFPKGKYAVIGAMSHDGLTEDPPEINMILSKVATPTVPDGSSIGTEGGAQGLTKLGTFLGSGTGAWSSNDLIPLQDDNNNIVTIDLDGLTTLRLTFNAQDGDADWLAFYCLDCVDVTPTNPTIAINGAGGIKVTYTGTLQGSDVVTAGWANVAGATSPYTPPAGKKAQFYRSVSP